MENNYPKAYKEVVEILNFVPKESIDKIPTDLITIFKEKMDKTYNFNVDINKSFEEQKILDETKAILANIFRDYWATPYQKEKIEMKEKYDRQKIENKKREKYNPDVFYKEKIENININKNQENNNLPIEVKKEKFYYKIIKFFKKIFHIDGEQ